ncbi:MAG: nucleotidyltransferase domain-containing protein [Oscillospiraceae bacterium]|nr:nucleotidyltransferase domain-containing protein [Oscillospiraceae bacterium]
MKIYTVDEIKEISVPIAKAYGVKKLALFGSYARGEAREWSDIDFVIDKGSSEKLRGLDYFGFILDLEDAMKIDVDVITYDSLKKSPIAYAIEDEVVLYEHE